jgi:Icc-related predicted phosphoesterase
MKYLLFSDIHCDRTACERLVEKSADADIVIGAGDFGLLRKGVQETIDALSGIDAPTILVPGNHESDVELRDACRGLPHFQVLHGRSTEVLGVRLFGIGGGIPTTPFGSWSVDLSEQDAQRLLPASYSDFVFVSHSPPWGCLDTLNDQQHVGSRAVRAFVEVSRPAFVVCGHIHENAGGQDDVDGIPVINAGPGGIAFECPF